MINNRNFNNIIYIFTYIGYYIYNINRANEKGRKWNCSLLRDRTICVKHITKQGRNMADHEIPLASTKLMENKMDKSCATCKLCHAKVKSRCSIIVGP